jgi:hypothetical protein
MPKLAFPVRQLPRLAAHAKQRLDPPSQFELANRQGEQFVNRLLNQRIREVSRPVLQEIRSFVFPQEEVG